MSRPRIRTLTLDWARQRRLLATILLLVGASLLLYWFVDALRSVLTPVFVAWVIAYALDPLIDRFERRGISRTPAIIIVLLVLMAATFGFAFLIIPELVHQVVVFTSKLPEKLELLRSGMTEWVATTFQGEVEVPETFDDVVAQFGDEIRAFAVRALGGATSIVQVIFNSTFTALAAFANLLLIPLFSFYLLRDFDRHIAKIRTYLPAPYRPRIEAIAHDVDRTMAGFFRGQLTVMLIQSTIYGLSLYFLGVPLGLGIGILTGLLCFIPYLGQLTGLSLAIVMCLLDYQSGAQIAGVLMVYAVVNLLDGLVITPRVVGGKVGLSPIAVIIALLVFGKLLGFVGVLLAVPFAAVFKILLAHGLEAYQKSALFLGDDRRSSMPPPGAATHLPGAPPDMDEDIDTKVEAAPRRAVLRRSAPPPPPAGNDDTAATDEPETGVVRAPPVGEGGGARTEAATAPAAESPPARAREGDDETDTKAEAASRRAVLMRSNPPASDAEPPPAIPEPAAPAAAPVEDHPATPDHDAEAAAVSSTPTANGPQEPRPT